jgi:hypothetical protein
MGDASFKQQEGRDGYEKQRLTELLNRLPSELIPKVTSFLSLDNVHGIRGVCRLFRTVCDNDQRWLPIIAPPHLQDAALTVQEHGRALRKEYFSWKAWYMRTARLPCDVKAGLDLEGDGWCSLAPWRHPRGIPSYPNPLLHRMVYHS